MHVSAEVKNDITVPLTQKMTFPHQSIGSEKLGVLNAIMIVIQRMDNDHRPKFHGEIG